ncbi:5112_t:CDS:2 [Cetraspora pellucida]|uniref:5112_t:CDS:1 n=1 Tax=Cetraspora pellucida TaxID=1433469 RepID=A0A9N9H6N5_9GLOM|nr:5112_t:CDS:2 [Cetraspora pellucida]
MSCINSKDKCKVSNIRKCAHAENNSTTTSEQKKTQLNAKSSNNPSYLWHYFTVLEDKVHAQCQICDRKGKSVKYVFHGTTRNMIYHLENEHGILKKNPTGNVEDGNIEDFFEVAHGKAACKKQPIIEITMQLTELLQDTYFVSITTDLWFSCNDKPYIEVTARWIDSKDWSLKEALLACEKINEKHTDENIKNDLEKVIERFQLNVTKGLNATGAFKKHVTNLILFFNGSSKNTENLRDAQCKLNYQKVYEVLLDVQTCWNSMYIAWKRLHELKNAILYLITILKFSSEKDNKDDTSYLEQINLTELK